MGFCNSSLRCCADEKFTADIQTMNIKNNDLSDYKVEFSK